jgi:HD-like signal output (HDOD) protein
MSVGPPLSSDADILQAAEQLPTAPRLLVEFGRLMHQPQVESDEVVALLRQDPPLVAQIIRMANSVAYAPPEPIGSLERAIAFIGFAETHRLVGAVAATQLADQKIALYPIDAAKLRLNALLVAVLMEELAKWTRERPRSCYTVGLLRTIGMMALERLTPSPAGTACSFQASGETALDAWEQKNWGVTNVEVAEKILLHWRLPHETALAIRYHYQPENRHNPIIHLLMIASRAAVDLKHGIPGEESYWRLTTETFSRAGLAPACFPTICQKAQRKFEQLKIAVG